VEHGSPFIRVSPEIEPGQKRRPARLRIPLSSACQQQTQPEGVDPTLLRAFHARGVGETADRVVQYLAKTQRQYGTPGMRIRPLSGRSVCIAVCTVNPANYVVGEGELTGFTDSGAAVSAIDAVTVAILRPALARP
jgi:hypothetical protein